MKGIFLTALAVGVGAASLTAEAQNYPTRPVRMLVAFPAGGSADIVARILGQKLTEVLSQQVVVENRPGAGGNLAFEALARAEADGYTILNSTPGIVINPSLYRKVTFKIEDFAAISHVGEAPLLIMVHPSVPARSLQELIKLAKAKPGDVRYGSAGNGSSSHLASEVFRMMAGLEMMHVPYKGGGPAFTELIGGQIEMTSLPIAESLPYVKAGRVRALAQTGTRRSATAPDIPTVEEAGIKGYNVTTWYVVYAPARTPKELIARLNAELLKVLAMPDTRERLAKSGVDIVGSTSEQAAQFTRDEYVKWAKMIKASGAKID